MNSPRWAYDPEEALREGDITFDFQVRSEAERLAELLGHVPRHTSGAKYNLPDSIVRWASRNLPDELIVPTIEYVTDVCALNTWTEADARSHIEMVITQHSHLLPTTLPVLVSADPDSRSMSIMASLTRRAIPWTGVPQNSGLLKLHIGAIEDCIHTGHSVIKALERWKDSVRPLQNFQVHLITLSAHSEGIAAVRQWVEEQGGSLLDYGVGKRIERFSVREGKRFPWTMVPDSDFERAALEYPEVATYLSGIRRLGNPVEQLTEAQAQDSQPSQADLIGAVGLLLFGVRAYQRGLEKWTSTGGIRPMGYIQEWDPLKRHHILGFGSPFTWWMGVPNTSPLGIWASPPLLTAPSLFVRRRMDEGILPRVDTKTPSPSDLDDLPF